MKRAKKTYLPVKSGKTCTFYEEIGRKAREEQLYFSVDRRNVTITHREGIGSRDLIVASIRKKVGRKVLHIVLPLTEDEARALGVALIRGGGHRS